MPTRVIGGLRAIAGDALRLVVVSSDELPVADAVSAYPFNSQILTGADGKKLVIAPEESRDSLAARRFLDRVVAEGHVAVVHYLEVRESMNNGGGPACLRQRIVLTDDEKAAIRANVFLTETLADALEAWIEKHYRDRLSPADLADPALWRQGMLALDELTQILRLGSVYEFQKKG